MEQKIKFDKVGHTLFGYLHEESMGQLLRWKYLSDLTFIPDNFDIVFKVI